MPRPLTEWQEKVKKEVDRRLKRQGEGGAIDASQIARRLDCTTPEVRRVLESLVKRGELRKMHIALFDRTVYMYPKEE